MTIPPWCREKVMVYYYYYTINNNNNNFIETRLQDKLTNNKIQMAWLTSLLVVG